MHTVYLNLYTLFMWLFKRDFKLPIRNLKSLTNKNFQAVRSSSEKDLNLIDRSMHRKEQTNFGFQSTREPNQIWFDLAEYFIPLKRSQHTHTQTLFTRFKPYIIDLCTHSCIELVHSYLIRSWIRWQFSPLRYLRATV